MNDKQRVHSLVIMKEKKGKLFMLLCSVVPSLYSFPNDRMINVWLVDQFVFIDAVILVLDTFRGLD